MTGRPTAAFTFVFVLATAPAVADTAKGNAMTANATTLTPLSSTGTPAPAGLPHLDGHRLVSQRDVAVDGAAARLARYERSDGRNAGLGGEHVSMVVDATGRLKGFARMDLDLVGGKLPTQDEARAIAMAFLAQAAPDLLPTLSISWIDRHDEPLRVTRDGRSRNLTLTGMKVKMRNTADGRWFWVIVSADRQVMVFERDIVWISFPGHRKTEKWLHDAWLAEKGLPARAS